MRVCSTLPHPRKSNNVNHVVQEVLGSLAARSVRAAVICIRSACNEPKQSFGYVSSNNIDYVNLG